MTILSKKKKSLQGKSGVETSDTSTHQGNCQPQNIPIGLLPNQISDRHQERSSPPQCWTREQDDYDSLSSCGSGRSRKRHRTSPHNASRGSKIQDRCSSSSPKAGPSACTDDSTEGGGVGSGYNSGDEYDSRIQLSESERLEKRSAFEKSIRKKGWQIKHMNEDGACLFRAIADQVYGDQEMHDVVRKHCIDYIASNRDYFSQYVTEDFNHYLDRKRLASTHGNHIEMQAMSEIYNRNIEVYCFGKEPINTFHGKQETDNEPIRLSYESRHYNSIVDPHKATIGVGLGLPSFTPGAADTNLISDAVRKSEELDIEKTMLEDKLRATDWEATNEAIEEQVARQSYMQWLKDNEKQNKDLGPQSSASASTSTAPSSTSTVPCSPSRHSPSSPRASTLKELETEDTLPPEFLGLDEWEDAGILAKVLATSQQEYLDNLKKAYKNEPPEDNEGKN